MLTAGKPVTRRRTLASVAFLEWLPARWPTLTPQFGDVTLTVEFAATLPQSNLVAKRLAYLQIVAALQARSDFHRAPPPDPITDAAMAIGCSLFAVSSSAVFLGTRPAMRGHVGYTAQPARIHGNALSAVRAWPFKAHMSRPKVRVSRCVEDLPHPLAAYSDFRGDACHVLVLTVLGGSDNALGVYVVRPQTAFALTIAGAATNACFANPNSAVGAERFLGWSSEVLYGDSTYALRRASGFLG